MKPLTVTVDTLTEEYDLDRVTVTSVLGVPAGSDIVMAGPARHTLDAYTETDEDVESDDVAVETEKDVPLSGVTE